MDNPVLVIDGSFAVLLSIVRLIFFQRSSVSGLLILERDSFVFFAELLGFSADQGSLFFDEKNMGEL